MTELKRILVGVDAEGQASDAVGVSGAIAKTTGARLHLLHVVEPTRRPWALAPALPAEEIERRGKDALRIAGLALPPEVAVTTHSVQGHPTKVILESARSLPADLVVLGRHKSGLLDHFIGSTAQRVLRLAPCPVLVHKTASRAFPKTVLVAVDLSPNSLHALEVFLSIAPTLGSSVHLLYVFEPPDLAYHTMGITLPHDVVDSIRTQEYKAFEERIAGIDWRGIPHVASRCEGEPAPTILMTAKDIGAEMIVVGTQGRTGLDRFLLGSVAEYVVRRAETSIFVVPPKSG